MKQLKPMSQDDKVSIRWCLYVVLFMLIILVIALCTIGRMVMGYEVAEVFDACKGADWEVNLKWANEFQIYPCGETQKEQLLDMISSSKFSKTRLTESLWDSSCAEDNFNFELTITEDGGTVLYARKFVANDRKYLLIDHQGKHQILQLRSPWAAELNDFVFIYKKENSTALSTPEVEPTPVPSPSPTPEAEPTPTPTPAPAFSFVDIAVEELQKVRDNPLMEEEWEIVPLIELYLLIKADQIVHYDQPDYDYAVFYDANSEHQENLLTANARTKAMKDTWKGNSVQLDWYTVDLDLTYNRVTIEGDTAAVDVYSILKFIEAGRDHMSSMGVAYDIDLVKIDGVWYITDVASNDHGF